MAEIAFVSDISGVCSSRETLRITNSPVNVASMNTNNSVKIVESCVAFGRRRRGGRRALRMRRTWFDLSFVRYAKLYVVHTASRAVPGRGQCEI